MQSRVRSAGRRPRSQAEMQSAASRLSGDSSTAPHRLPQKSPAPAQPGDRERGRLAEMPPAAAAFFSPSLLCTESTRVFATTYWLGDLTLSAWRRTSWTREGGSTDGAAAEEQGNPSGLAVAGGGHKECMSVGVSLSY